MTSLPLLVVELSRVFLDQIDALSKKIAELEQATAREAAQASDDTPPADHAGRRADHGHGDRDLRTADGRSSNADAISPPGSGLSLGSIRPAANSFSEGRRRWDSATFGDC